MATEKKTRAKPAAPKAAKAAVVKPSAGMATGAPASTAMAPDAAHSAATSAELRLRGLIERVAQATGGRKPEIKAVTEAVLRELGQALSAGQVLNLPGLGKARVARTGAGPAGVLTVKLRPSRGAGQTSTQTPDQPLAADQEGS